MDREPDATMNIDDEPTLVADAELHQAADTCPHGHPWDDCGECDRNDALSDDESDDQALGDDELDAGSCVHGIKRTHECADCDAEMERELDRII